MSGIHILSILAFFAQAYVKDVVANEDTEQQRANSDSDAQSIDDELLVANDETSEQRVSYDSDAQTTVDKLFDKAADKFTNDMVDKIINKLISKAYEQHKKSSKKKKKKKGETSKTLDYTTLGKPGHLGYGPAIEPPPARLDPNDYFTFDLPMTLGETRKITIPADQAYGAEGVGCRTDGNDEKKCIIPPNTPLEFSIELVSTGRDGRR
eukprot:gnl/MRDRNA2_/MRDRNA2_27281_c0_seq1.p1 gnl/MRDRNA2_/MRDRNA2_27281_c0~~gnl/MRDRNA2_/MRDRNA2_27281_c0_seq1.p1  ORF type:complete len:209 (-),score=43.90 gnl/MRDRNA2_/MRDRNA2_27281_c0_seq1:133-759(-)